MNPEVRWRDAIKDPPKVRGEYFVVHPRYGRCVYGWNDGWGQDDDPLIAKPLRWIDENEDSGKETSP